MLAASQRAQRARRSGADLENEHHRQHCPSGGPRKCQIISARRAACTVQDGACCLPRWWLRREGQQAVSRCELRLWTARTARFLPHSTRPVSLAGRAHAQGKREHAARMPLPCHEAPHESRGCRKLTMSLYVRASGEGGCAARFVCVLVRAVGSLRALYLTGLARRAAGCVHVGTAGALAPWCRHGALRSNARSETPRSVGATGEVLRS